MKKSIIPQQIWKSGDKCFKVIRTTPRTIFGYFRNGNRGRFTTTISKISRPDLHSGFRLA